MQKYFIGNQGFKTKKECENFTRNIINELKTCRIDENHKYYSFFSSLIKNHPECEEKVGAGIEYFYIESNPMNRKTYQTMIKRIDDSVIDFSWVYCCQFKVRSSKYDLNMAMRQAIMNDIIKFKKSSNLICSICKNENRNYEDYHVDHNEPPFRTLRDNFLLNENLNIPVLFGDCPTSKLTIFKDEDNEFKHQWIKFHNDNCSLQILCKECNMKKH